MPRGRQRDGGRLLRDHRASGFPVSRRFERFRAHPRRRRHDNGRGVARTIDTTTTTTPPTQPQVGDTGSTTVEESQTLSDDIEFTEGYTIDRGYLSPYFVSDQERQVCEMAKPRILVTDGKLDSVKEVRL